MQVTRLAGTKGWTVSAEPTAAQKAVGAALGKQQGAEFDKAVMDKVVAASQQSVSAYEDAGQSTDSANQSIRRENSPALREEETPFSSSA